MSQNRRPKCRRYPFEATVPCQSRGWGEGGVWIFVRQCGGNGGSMVLPDLKLVDPICTLRCPQPVLVAPVCVLYTTHIVCQCGGFLSVCCLVPPHRSIGIAELRLVQVPLITQTAKAIQPLPFSIVPELRRNAFGETFSFSGSATKIFETSPSRSSKTQLDVEIELVRLTLTKSPKSTRPSSSADSMKLKRWLAKVFRGHSKYSKKAPISMVPA